MEGKLAYIGLGANLGDRLGTLQRAVDLLAEAENASALRVSRVYESPPWGYASAHPFLNAVAELHWESTPDELREECALIEIALGRMQRRDIAQSYDTAPCYSDRVIDLDLLWFEDVTCNSVELVLPHPRAHQRAFVLLPWLELAPQLELSGRALHEWLAEVDHVEVAATQLCLMHVLTAPR